MAGLSDIKKGFTFDDNGQLWTVIEFQHVKPGKGPAFVRTKIKSLNSGKIVDTTYNQSISFKPARVERRHYQFLYKDEAGYNFMNNETFEQISLQEDIIDAPEFLRDGSEVEILMHAETEAPLTCELPQFITAEVTYTEPGAKGNTATNVTKPATVDTGATLSVPIFIKEGDKLKIDTKKKAYVERVK